MRTSLPEAEISVMLVEVEEDDVLCEDLLCYNLWNNLFLID
jgi:hypothetical protein